MKRTIAICFVFIAMVLGGRAAAAGSWLLFTPLGGGVFSNVYSLSVVSGSSQYADCGTISPERTDSWSIGGWFYPVTGSGALIGNREASGMGFDIQTSVFRPYVQLIHDNVLNLIAIQANPGNTLPQNTWSHLVVTYPGTSQAADVLVYINGALVPTTTISDTLSATMVSSGTFQIGGESALPYFSTGYSNQVFYKNSVLSGAQVAAIYNAGVPQSLSSFSLTHWWQFQNNYTDSIGSNNCTGVNSPTFVTNVP